MQGIPVGRVFGIAVRLDWSVLVIFWLLTWGLATGAFPALAPGYADTEYWAVAGVTSVAFLASLLAHELSHSLVARRRGVNVRDITLWLFGGVATLEGEARTPAADLAIALAGPIASVAFAAAMFGAALLLDALGSADLFVASAVWLASINAVLAVFNLAPAAPLDGGRVLRALLWRRRGDRESAAISATRAGRVFGWILVVGGLVEFAFGGSVGGLWLVMLGWFVMSAARNEEQQTILTHELAGVLVRDVMSTNPITAPEGLTVDELLHSYMLRHRCSAFPLVDATDQVVGLVTLARLRTVPPARRAHTMVRDVAWAIDVIPQVSPGDPLLALLPRLGEHGDGRALVFGDGRLVGIVTPTDIARAVRFASLDSTQPTSHNTTA